MLLTRRRMSPRREAREPRVRCSRPMRPWRRRRTRPRSSSIRSGELSDNGACRVFVRKCPLAVGEMRSQGLAKCLQLGEFLIYILQTNLKQIAHLPATITTDPTLVADQLPNILEREAKSLRL